MMNVDEFRFLLMGSVDGMCSEFVSIFSPVSSIFTHWMTHLLSICVFHSFTWVSRVFFNSVKTKKKTKNRRKRKELDQSIPIMFRLHAIRSSSSSQQHGRFGQSSVTVSSMFTCQFVLIGLFGLFGQLLGRLLFPHQWIVRLLLSLGLRSFHLLLDFILKENSKTKVNTQRKKKKQTKQIQTKRERR